MAMAVALAWSLESLFVLTAGSPSAGGVVSVQGEVRGAGALLLWALCRGLVLGSVCWLVDVNFEVTAVPLGAVRSGRWSKAGFICLTLGVQTCQATERLLDSKRTERRNLNLTWNNTICHQRGVFLLEQQRKLKYQFPKTLCGEAL